MRTSCFFYCLFTTFFFITGNAFAQTVNFDETWKEFLENDKISNMSELVKPDKVYNQPDYAKYLLMNANTCFCQSNQRDAESLMAETREIDTEVLESVPGFVGKMEELQTKIEAYHSMDAIWKRFLQTKEVTAEELEAVPAAKSVCEKRTLAKYSYMTAYTRFCQGDISGSKDIFENRTLKLIERTTLRTEDVEGLASEAAKMKSMFKGISKLDIAWKTYIKTGVSPGFDIELPLFPCYPIPNMKELVLNGVLDLCDSGPETLEKIAELEADSGVAPEGELEEKVEELQAAVEQNDSGLSTLNEAWASFIPDNKVRHLGKYGYQYCSVEPLIRAYIMDGFVFVCEMGEEMLHKIDSLYNSEEPDLEEITMTKINELSALTKQYRSNGLKIERLWSKFVAQGGSLAESFQSTDHYCDNIQLVKDWTIKGLTGDCEDGYRTLDKIETLHETIEFEFSEELECQIQNLRVKVWDCRYDLLLELAQVETSPGPYEERLEELMKEYGMGEQPEVCSGKK